MVTHSRNIYMRNLRKRVEWNFMWAQRAVMQKHGHITFPKLAFTKMALPPIHNTIFVNEYATRLTDYVIF